MPLEPPVTTATRPASPESSIHTGPDVAAKIAGLESREFAWLNRPGRRSRAHVHGPHGNGVVRAAARGTVDDKRVAANRLRPPADAHGTGRIRRSQSGGRDDEALADRKE